MNNYERQGYACCVLDYDAFGDKYCKEMLEKLKLEDERITETYIGYELALADLLDKTIVI